jgi:ribosome-binding protein aMBF1 (putative translation factor)
MTRIRELHEQWMDDPEYRAEYERLAPEFELAQALIEARTRAGLTQEELADRMKTTQSAIARIESGKCFPSTSTLRRFAQATGTHLKITFEHSVTA